MSGSVAFGGDAAAGADAMEVILNNTGDVRTDGVHSDGLLAQSIGGAGGDGGFSIAGSFGTGTSADSASAAAAQTAARPASCTSIAPA